MDILIIAVLIGLIPAAVASTKGYNFFAWWLFGALLFIVALPWAIVMKPNRPVLEAQELAFGHSKKCPACAELVKSEAKVCKHCGADVSDVA